MSSPKLGDDGVTVLPDGELGSAHGADSVDGLTGGGKDRVADALTQVEAQEIPPHVTEALETLDTFSTGHDYTTMIPTLRSHVAANPESPVTRALNTITDYVFTSPVCNGRLVLPVDSAGTTFLNNLDWNMYRGHDEDRGQKAMKILTKEVAVTEIHNTGTVSLVVNRTGAVVSKDNPAELAKIERRTLYAQGEGTPVFVEQEKEKLEDLDDALFETAPDNERNGLVQRLVALGEGDPQFNLTPKRLALFLIQESGLERKDEELLASLIELDMGDDATVTKQDFQRYCTYVGERGEQLIRFLEYRREKMPELQELLADFSDGPSRDYLVNLCAVNWNNFLLARPGESEPPLPVNTDWPYLAESIRMFFAKCLEKGISLAKVTPDELAGVLEAKIADARKKDEPVDVQ